MSQLLQPQVKATPLQGPSFTAVQGGLLQRKCACGGSPAKGDECEACREKRLQRTSENAPRETSNASAVPPIVHEVLHAPGQPLDYNCVARAPHRRYRSLSADGSTSQRTLHQKGQRSPNSASVGRSRLFGLGRPTRSTDLADGNFGLLFSRITRAGRSPCTSTPK